MTTLLSKIAVNQVRAKRTARGKHQNLAWFYKVTAEAFCRSSMAADAQDPDGALQLVTGRR